MNGSSIPSFDPSRLTKAAAADYSSSASESEDEYLAPGVDDNDFGDFNPRKRRRIGGNNKEKAALGIFGSDSEDDGPGRKWKRKTLRNKGMSFVATGAQNDKKAEDDGSEESEDARPMLGNNKMDEDEEEDDDEEEEGRGIGLGFKGAAGGLGWASDPKQQSPESMQTTRRRL